VLLASACVDAKGFARKITLLEDEHVAEHCAQEVSERERQAQFEVLTLLQTRGSELCHSIISPARSRHHLSKGMRLAALRHTEMVGNFPHSGRWFPLPRSQCLGARPATPPTRR
jgi:hypothetical protein